MQSRLEQVFRNAAAETRLALGIYLVPGYPDWSTSQQAIDLSVAAGVDFIEFPILGSGTWSRRTGGTIANALQSVGVALRQDHQRIRAWLESAPVTVGVVYEGAWPAAHAWQAETSLRDRADGLLLEHSASDQGERVKQSTRWGIPLIATVDGEKNACSDEERQALEAATGFVYLSLGGRTGERSCGPLGVKKKISEIRAHGCPAPICTAFGIQSPDDITEIATAGPNGIVIGSAAVEMLGESLDTYEHWLESIIRTCRVPLTEATT